MPFSRFSQDQRGAVSVIAAFASVAILGMAAMAVDLGSVFLQTRKLQGVADLAAVAAARDIEHAQAAAQAAADASGWSTPLTVLVVTGTYTNDPAIAVNARFSPGGATVDAVRVTMTGPADLYFATAIMGKQNTTITRTATAAQARLAAFSLGTRLAALDGGVANSVLTALTGSEVTLTVMDYQALATADVDLFQYAGALATHAHLEGASFDEVLAADITSKDALSVFAKLLQDDGEQDGAQALNALAASVDQGKKAQLNRLIELGPYGSQDHVSGGSGAGVRVNALDMANALLLLAEEGRQLKIDMGAGVPGLASTTLWLAIGERANDAPWMTVAKDGSTTIRTAQMRLYLDTKITAGPELGALGVAQVNVPIFVEAAQSEAKLSSIDCGAGSVKLSAQPSLGNLNIGQINTADLDDFTHDITVQPANLVSLLLLSVTGSASVEMGGGSWQEVSFSKADIAAGTIKTVSTNDIAEASLGSLINNLSLTVKIGGLGLGLNGALVSAALKKTLSSATASVDGVVNSLTDLLGVHLGQADLRVTGLRCKSGALMA